MTSEATQSPNDPEEGTLTAREIWKLVDIEALICDYRLMGIFENLRVVAASSDVTIPDILVEDHHEHVAKFNAKAYPCPVCAMAVSYYGSAMSNCGHMLAHAHCVSESTRCQRCADSNKVST